MTFLDGNSWNNISEIKVNVSMRKYQIKEIDKLRNKFYSSFKVFRKLRTISEVIYDKNFQMVCRSTTNTI